MMQIESQLASSSSMLLLLHVAFLAFCGVFSPIEGLGQQYQVSKAVF